MNGEEARHCRASLFHTTPGSKGSGCLRQPNPSTFSHWGKHRRVSRPPPLPATQKRQLSLINNQGQTTVLFCYAQARVSNSSIAAVIRSPSCSSVAIFSPSWSVATETISSGCSTTSIPSTVKAGFNGAPARAIKMAAAHQWNDDPTAVAIEQG